MVDHPRDHHLSHPIASVNPSSFSAVLAANIHYHMKIRICAVLAANIRFRMKIRMCALLAANIHFHMKIRIRAVLSANTSIRGRSSKNSVFQKFPTHCRIRTCANLHRVYENNVQFCKLPTSLTARPCSQCFNVSSKQCK